MTVTVRQLLTLLSDPTVNPDAEVFAWLDSVRFVLDPLQPVDAWGQTYLDLNLWQRPTRFEEIDQDVPF